MVPLPGDNEVTFLVFKSRYHLFASQLTQIKGIGLSFSALPMPKDTTSELTTLITTLMLNVKREAVITYFSCLLI